MTPDEQPRLQLRVINDLGLHARVAAKIAALVQQYDSEVFLSKGGITAEGDSVLSILTLDAPKGATLLAAAQGPQAPDVLAALQKLFASGFGDGNV